MPEIGRWVIHEACRQLRVWHDMGLTGISVGINLSAQELQRPGIVDLMREALAENGIDGRYLDIEITESSLMEHVERVAEVIMELKRLGLSLSLDDFGTGYSSLAYLNHFALDKLKIDRSFVVRLGRDPGADAITRAIVAMAHELGLRVVAEGVETPAQAQRLREYGCDIFQGYLYGRPVDAGTVEQMLMGQVAADV
jgi:EAL domain-containing protein (putative c-di-GMP-specific phosphodiesterase class I)